MNPVLHTFADDEFAEQPKVLLVDDDEVNLMLTAIALRERGFEVEELTRGEDALRHLAERAPDMVVLDALMPGLDGFQTSRRCVRCRPTPTSRC